MTVTTPVPASDHLVFGPAGGELLTISSDYTQLGPKLTDPPPTARLSVGTFDSIVTIVLHLDLTKGLSSTYTPWLDSVLALPADIRPAPPRISTWTLGIV